MVCIGRMKLLMAAALWALTCETAVAFLPSPALPLRVQTRATSCTAVRMSADRQDRRQAVFTMAGLAAAATVPLLSNVEGVSAAEEEDVEVYFGCGCFWHVQHEFVEAERRILKRADADLSARAGYAGGNGGMKDGKVCYHNAAQIADYGSLGHGEVVRLKIPPSSFPLFAQEYAKLFDAKGNRPDQFQDRGREYRNLVGVPGGVASPLAQALVAASAASGDKLDFARGKGDDPDATAVAFVMDTNTHPFFVAEQYHQFHDGFNPGEGYPREYNALAGAMAKAGTLGPSLCPNGLLGVGVLGL